MNARKKSSQQQESVWDFPRPPRVEPVQERIKIIFNGEVIADTSRGFRVLETSHPPTYYLPPADIRLDFLTRSDKTSYCEWKGQAVYYDLTVGGETVRNTAWSYPDPTPDFQEIKGHLAFYAGPMDGCYLGAEQVIPQPGGFYGGWITENLEGPFKGGAGTQGW